MFVACEGSRWTKSFRLIVGLVDIIGNSASGWYTQSMLTYNNLKDHPREFLAATGLTREEFERLLPIYSTSYVQQYPAQLSAKGKVRQRQPGGGSKGTLRQDADRLLFALVYLKTNPLQTMHGLQFGLSQAQANYWIHHLLPVVRAALAELALLPERDGTAVATSAVAVEGTPTWRWMARSAAANARKTLRRKRRTTAARKKPTPTRTSCSSTRAPTRWSIWARPRPGQAR